MKLSGFRIDVSQLRRKAEKLKKEVTAKKFRPILLKYVGTSLNTAVKLTPARSASTIKTAQTAQYANRIGYIPSIHTLTDPTLIVKPDGTNVLYCSGKWWLPALWTLPTDVYSAYQRLLAEHLRRLETPQGQFIEHRTQARNLYKLSWVQCGESLGLTINAPAAVKSSTTRREPPKNPPRGYGQVRGGKTIISVVIYNPFINDDSKYRTWDGKEIIDTAMAKHRAAFNSACQKLIERITYAVMHS